MNIFVSSSAIRSSAKVCTTIAAIQLICFSGDLHAQNRTWDSIKNGNWTDFEEIAVPSSYDGKEQKMMRYRSHSGSAKPLLVSLHTWSGDFSQGDPLAALAKVADWNYLHPDFRGPNLRPEACASQAALEDIDDAIEYAKKNMHVDGAEIFVVGVSGGGHAACAWFLTTKQKIKRIVAWVPITDLVAWYSESQVHGNGYDKMLLSSTKSLGDKLNEAEARARSPLFMGFPQKPPCPIELYAGIDDGWNGTVSISHSLKFYNKVAMAFSNSTGLIDTATISALVNRDVSKFSASRKIEGRDVFFQTECPAAALTVFRGGHEMLSQYCFQRLMALSQGESDKKCHNSP